MCELPVGIGKIEPYERYEQFENANAFFAQPCLRAVESVGPNNLPKKFAKKSPEVGKKLEPS